MCKKRCCLSIFNKPMFYHNKRFFHLKFDKIKCTSKIFIFVNIPDIDREEVEKNQRYGWLKPISVLRRFPENTAHTHCIVLSTVHTATSPTAQTQNVRPFKCPAEIVLGVRYRVAQQQSNRPASEILEFDSRSDRLTLNTIFQKRT